MNDRLMNDVRVALQRSVEAATREVARLNDIHRREGIGADDLAEAKAVLSDAERVLTDFTAAATEEKS